MIRFENQHFLYLLFLLPAIVFLYWLTARWRSKIARQFGHAHLVNRLNPQASKWRPALKATLLITAITLIILALANPQIGSKMEKIERKGIDIMIALDVSNSMQAQDIQPNRLSRSQQAISRMLDKLANDRVGLIIFAGKAYTQLPMTTDYAAAKMFLSTVSSDMVPTQGTAIGEAITLAKGSFDREKASKAIIIITDGENHEDNAMEIARDAAKEGIHVYTIGMGLPEGAPIPIFQRGTITGYKKDKKGNTIITRLNEEMLQQIAQAGDGSYVRANNSRAGLEKIFNDISKLEKSEIDSKVFTDYEDRFQYLIAPAVLLLIIELLLASRKSRLAGKINLFGKKA